MSYTYLMAPYSHPDPEVRERRQRIAAKVAADLTRAGEFVYCPTAYGHMLTVLGNLPITHDFWMPHCMAFLRHATKAKVLMLDGWETSIGIGMELHVCGNAGIPVEYIEHDVPQAAQQQERTYVDDE